MKTLVLTGPIGGGKSTACRYLERKGIPVYDSDNRARSLYFESSSLAIGVEKALGQTFRDSSGRFDLRSLSAAVFGDAVAMARLEALVHPAVFADIVRWRDGLDPSAPFAVVESAVFLQKPMFHPLADFVIKIDAPLELRMERVQARDGLSREQVMQRVTLQDCAGAAEPDLLIMRDNGPQEELYARVDEALASLGLNNI